MSRDIGLRPCHFLVPISRHMVPFHAEPWDSFGAYQPSALAVSSFYIGISVIAPWHPTHGSALYMVAN